MEENVATRLKFFLESEGLSNSQFADTCGIPRPTLSQLLSGRNKKISDVLVGQIHASYPNLSIMWLLFGEGTMLKMDDSSLGASSENPSGEDGIADFRGANSFHNSDLASGDASFCNYRKENGVKSGNSDSDLSTIQRDNALKRIAELEREIMRLKAKPRKVVQITVYYDDNTFETFAPGV